MRKFLALFFSVFASVAFAQNSSVKGIVVDTQGKEPLASVTVTLDGTTLSTLTNDDGMFELTDVPTGSQVIIIATEGFLQQVLPVEITSEGLDLGMIFLEPDITEEQTSNLISLTESSLTDEGNGADVTSGLLQSSRDVYLNTAAFEFSQSFFRVRGLNTDNGKVLLNGIEMNKLYNGRPQWGNWGGLNDVMRNQEFTNGLTPSDYSFGGLIGTTNINLRASRYRPGFRITYSNSDRSYNNRTIMSYSTGLMQSGWAFTLAASRRWGDEGFNRGSFYDANSFMASVEYKFNDDHSLNFTGIYAPNRRGKSSPNTQEVYDLKGIRYNEYWGYYKGEKRNSRVRDIQEPIFMLNHYWNLSENTTLNTNVAYQFGKMGNSRIDYGGTDKVTANGQSYYSGNGSNPSPAYYQNLPSYFLRFDTPEYENAYFAEKEFVEDGQLDWDALYYANFSAAVNGKNAVYALYEDRSDNNTITANSIFKSDISENIIINAAANYKHLKSQNFAELTDLLGGTGYLDVDNFADDLTNNPDAAQNNLLNPDRIVGVGDKFKYNYNIYSDVIGGFAQAQFKYNKVDFFGAVTVTNTTYQREGLYQNGAFPNNSLGKGDKLNFTGVGGKAGLTYKITGRHLLDFNGSYATQAPSISNTYSNSRENNNVVPDISEEIITSFDASYIMRLTSIKARLTGYYNTIENANEISFYYADGIGGDNTAFLQEILKGVDKRNVGMELGVEAQITPTIKLKGAATVMESIYTNNPDLYLSSEDFIDYSLGDQTAANTETDEYGQRYYGKSYLENYKVATGPQRAYSVGFEYRDPDYWWFGATTNFFSNAYIDVSPLTRSANFYTDYDGQVFNDYDEDLARQLLKQEKFNSYMVVNLTGGKSWRINYKYYIGFFASINNLFDEVYKSGGFEQGRNANFRQLRDDKALETPVFGSKYWYGRGRTYFLNVYFRF
ncbi:CarboxypepD_reg-like domain-containing protein [Pustulibacterium marinum]|uniref:CarboxypepD_reg-like domain-containing protein n=1 Tax=Pustulibacterium marinum TaxID=1224947 RepID=A0A1I7I5E3_9FLAO|nr:carboxypeptidase-like regulatory domain-containing protein [Pustulibacterium marinum]SFU68148.1 CarboxypepD_reg-like domain-containing protein [Pustulibacterium marinum]